MSYRPFYISSTCQKQVSGSNLQRINWFQLKVNFSSTIKSKIIYYSRIPKIVEVAFVLFMKEVNSLCRLSGNSINFFKKLCT